MHAPLDVAQRRLPRARDVALVARDQLLADTESPGRRRPADRPARRPSTRHRAGVATTPPPATRSCSASRVPTCSTAFAIEVVEGGEVVRRRRQRQPGATGHGAVTDGVEAALAQQLCGRADQRVPSSFSLGSDCCRHALHAASNGTAAWRFRPIVSLSSGKSVRPSGSWRPSPPDGMMARMPAAQPSSDAAPRRRCGRRRGGRLRARVDAARAAGRPHRRWR